MVKLATRFFKPLDKLPTAEPMGLLIHAISYANIAVKRTLEEISQLEEDAACAKHKQRYTKTFTTEGRVKVGRDAAQIREVWAQKHFKLLNLGK